MKNSNIKWIGNIPDNWEMSKFKYVSTIYTGNSIKDEHKSNYESSDNARPYISSKDIDVHTGFVDYDNGLYVKNDDTSFRIAHKGSSLMCIEGGSAGKKKTFLNQDVCFVNKLCCFKGNSQINEKYLYFYLCNPSYEEEFRNNISGMIGGVSVSVLKNFSIIVPPLPTQTAIANFLDSKCSEIDTLITDINKQIDTLNELKKNTITEQFNKKKCLKLKHIGEFQNGVNFNTNKKETMIKFLGVGDFKDNFILDKITDFSDTQEDRIFRGNELLKSGDIVFVRSNGSKDLVGRSIMVDKIDFPLTYSGFCIRFRVMRDDICRKYLLYYCRSNAFKETIWNGNMGTAINNLSQGVLGNILIPVPTLAEQQQIADYLDAKCSEFDAIISDKQKQISTLETYKKSLIYEYVTGKKEV